MLCMLVADGIVWAQKAPSGSRPSLGFVGGEAAVQTPSAGADGRNRSRQDLYLAGIDRRRGTQQS